MLIDAHAHLDMYSDEELPAVLEALEHGRIFTLSTSIDVPSFERLRDISSRSTWVVPGFGIHPWEAHRYLGGMDELDRHFTEAAYVGEIGLDHRWVEDSERYPAQRHVLEHQLDVAHRQRKLVNVHTAGAERQVLDLIAGSGVERVIIHWYSGPLDVLADLIERGFFFTVGVQLVSSGAIREIAKAIPIDRLLTETDNPGGLEWLTGERGMPDAVPAVLNELARVKDVTPDDLAGAVLANLRRLVGADPHFAPWQDLLAE